MRTAERVVGVLLEQRRRFFVYLSPEAAKPAKERSVGSYQHKVLDRDVVVDGHYKVMKERLNYTEAFQLAEQMNAQPDRAEELAAQFKPSPAPGHNLGWPGGERIPRTF